MENILKLNGFWETYVSDTNNYPESKPSLMICKI
jgi:hypothetical protein